MVVARYAEACQPGLEAKLEGGLEARRTAARAPYPRPVRCQERAERRDPIAA